MAHGFSHGGGSSGGNRTFVHNSYSNTTTTNITNNYNNGGGNGWGGWNNGCNHSYLGGLIQVNSGYNGGYSQQIGFGGGFGGGYGGYNGSYGGYPRHAYPGQQYPGGYAAPSSGPGWLERQWDGLCNWFSNVFGGSDNKTTAQTQQPPAQRYTPPQTGGDPAAMSSPQQGRQGASNLVHLTATDAIPYKLDPRTNTLLMKEVSPAQAEALQQNMLNDRDMQAALHMAFATELNNAIKPRFGDAGIDMHENAEIQKIKDAIHKSGAQGFSVDADTLALIEKRNNGRSVAALAQQFLVDASQHNEKVTEIRAASTPSAAKDPSKNNGMS